MFKRFQDRVGTAGLIVAIVALVAAMGGGAYAAKSALTGNQKKEVERIAKKFAGKPGAEGKQGSAGAAGQAGAKGDTGSAGAAGAEGKSVTVTPIPIGTAGACESTGGAAVKREGSSSGSEVCNGEEGPQGPAGSPWVVDGLPSGKTEMGTWATGKWPTETAAAYVPISFTVPLADGATVAVHFVNILGEEEEFSTPSGVPATICTGSPANPTAPAGTLCVYAKNQIETTFESANNPMGGASGTAGKVGGILVMHPLAEGFARGVWAATAP